MTDIRERLHVFDRLEPPDLWEEALRRELAPPRAQPFQPSRRLMTVLVALAIGVGGIVIAVRAFRPGPAPSRPVLAGAVVLAREAHTWGTGVAVDAQSLWIIQANRVLRLDRRSLRITGIVHAPVGDQDSITVAEGMVWVTSTRTASVVGIDPSSLRVVAHLPTFKGDEPVQVLAGLGRVWVVAATSGTGRLLVMNPTETGNAVRAGRPLIANIPLDASPRLGLTLCNGSAWVDDGGRSLLRVSPSGAHKLFRWSSGPGGGGLACAAGNLWEIRDGDVVRLSVQNSSVRVTAAVAVPGESPVALAGSGDSLWVMTDTSSKSKSVYLPDPSKPSTVLRIEATDPAAGPSKPAPVGLLPGWLVSSGNRAWVLRMNGLDELRRA